MGHSCARIMYLCAIEIRNGPALFRSLEEEGIENYRKSQNFIFHIEQLLRKLTYGKI